MNSEAWNRCVGQGGDVGELVQEVYGLRAENAKLRSEKTRSWELVENLRDEVAGCDEAIEGYRAEVAKLREAAGRYFEAKEKWNIAITGPEADVAWTPYQEAEAALKAALEEKA